MKSTDGGDISCDSSWNEMQAVAADNILSNFDRKNTNLFV